MDLFQNTPNKALDKMNNFPKYTLKSTGLYEPFLKYTLKSTGYNGPFSEIYLKKHCVK